IGFCSKWKSRRVNRSDPLRTMIYRFALLIRTRTDKSRSGFSLASLCVSSRVEVAGAGFEKASAAFLRFRSRLMLQRLQIRQVGLAKRTADHLEVNGDVILQVPIQRVEVIAAELLASGTG